MKSGMSLYSYSGDIMAQKMNVYDAIEHSAEIGCKGIELVAEQHIPNWPYPTYKDLVDLREKTESLGMKIVVMSCYIGTMIRSNRDQTQEELINYAKQEIFCANVLGAKIVRPMYFAVGDLLQLGNEQVVDQKKEMIDIITACLPDLKKYDMVWGLELHAPYPIDYLTDIVKRIDSPYVKLILDFSMWQTQGLPSEYGCNPVETVKDLIPYTCHCHGKSHNFNDEGEEPFTPYKEIIMMLKESHYDGYVVAEYEGWHLRYLDGRTMAKKNFDLINKYIECSTLG